MVKVLGLEAAQIGYDCPLGKSTWSMEDVRQFVRRKLAYRKRTGRIFDPKKEDPNHLFDRKDWYWITFDYHPVFDIHGKYLGYKCGGNDYAPDGERTNFEN